MTVSDEPIHFFSRGADSLVIDLSMHQNNRAKLLDVLGATGCPADALIFSGGSELPVYN
jgi:hypothetical protein